jgi:NAD-dependent DNA ligase
MAKYLNEQKRCLGALLGIAQGVICDRNLTDEEIRFLNEWLAQNEEICQKWPGNILRKRIKEVLADGVVTDDERAYLVGELQRLIGGDAQTLAAATHVTELAFDELTAVQFNGMTFCLTGDFVYGPRDRCSARIEKEGGEISQSVTKKLHYLVVGSLGSPEWKHGSFGTKIERAMKYKDSGHGISIVREKKIFF